MVRRRNIQHYRSLEAPGRTPNDDSIDASSEDPDRTQDGYSFSAGYESSAATRIGEDEESDHDRLRELNEGRHRSDGEHSVRESRRDKGRIAQAICSSLPLANREKQKVTGVVKQIDYSCFGNQKGIPRVTLGVVAVVVDEQHRDISDISDLVQRTDEFRSVREAHDISMSDIVTIKEKVRDAIQENEGLVTVADKKPMRDPALPDPTPEKPPQYWEECSPQYWVNLAKSWERLADELKEAVPDQYRERVDQLRRWKPWEDENDSSEECDEVSDRDHREPNDDETFEEEIDRVLEEMLQNSSE